MTEIEPYAIAGIETVNIEQGSDQLPYFYKITSGQKDTRSLVFHAKIKTEYHQYTIRQVNKKSLNLACSLRKCYMGYMGFQSKFKPSIRSCYASLADFQDPENTTNS